MILTLCPAGGEISAGQRADRNGWLFPLPVSDRWSPGLARNIPGVWAKKHVSPLLRLLICLSLYHDRIPSIQREDFLKAQEEINEQIRTTQQSIDKYSRSTISKTDRNRIKDVLRDMAESEEFNDEFYRRVLSRMIVHDRTHVDVYLKVLPLETKFEFESVIEKRTKKKVGGDTSKGSSDTYIGNIFCTFCPYFSKRVCLFAFHLRSQNNEADC